MKRRAKIETAEPAIVFVVDDDISVREALVDLIQSVGLRVETFPTAAEFLRRSLPTEPSCLVLDVGLPGLSGIDLQRELAVAQRSIPIIFITGRGDIPTTVQAMKAGAVEFLTKPFSERDLLASIRQALTRDRDALILRTESATLRSRFETLTPRERDVMTLVVLGLMNKQIAAELGTHEATVKIQRGRVMRKMQAESLVDLVRTADRIKGEGETSRKPPAS